MRGFLERVEHSVQVDPAEPEIGGNRVAIIEAGVEHAGRRLAIPLAAEFRDCISGNDAGWRPIRVGLAKLLISKG